MWVGVHKAGANPVLVMGGGADPIYFINFLKTPMKLKKIWSMAGGGGCARAGSAPP